MAVDSGSQTHYQRTDAADPPPLFEAERSRFSASHGKQSVDGLRQLSTHSLGRLASMVKSALERLAVRHPGLRLRVVSSAFPEWPNVPIERISWSPETEVEALATADIGIMPLTDDDWSRGKCAFKLLQYMAASLPCIASPVGANHQAIVDGKTGFLVASTNDWEAALDKLISDPIMARAFGNAGRKHLDTKYSLTQYTTDYERLLTRLLGA
jgi:glycosyltransferase involved in cell wall biosynthesis